MKTIFKENGLSISLFNFFAITFLGQYLTGFAENNENLKQHHQPEITHFQYLSCGHFIEAVFENMESEFLQMAVYVVFTIFLFQKGLSESKKLDRVNRVDVILKDNPNQEKIPWAVKKG